MTAAPPGFVRVARLAALGPLSRVTVDGRAVCLVHAGDAVTALDDRCPHAEFALSAGELLADGSVECAWHGARFDRATGAQLDGPPCGPVRVHDVLLHDGDVLVRLAP
jgi:nitrite reductase/ring-hydroxylating ferredoxin subunit